MPLPLPQCVNNSQASFGHTTNFGLLIAMSYTHSLRSHHALPSTVTIFPLSLTRTPHTRSLPSTRSLSCILSTPFSQLLAFCPFLKLTGSPKVHNGVIFCLDDSDDSNPMCSPYSSLSPIASAQPYMQFYRNISSKI